VALAGEGAGGHLALATAMAARDAGLPLPRHVLAISPVAQTRTNTASYYLENALAKPLNRAMMVWCFEQLVPLREQLRDARLQLAQAELSGLPPVTLITARIDPLRSDAQKLQAALVRARVPVEWRDYEGVTNGFFGAAELVDKARQAQVHAGARLAAALAAPVPALPQRNRFREMATWLRRLLPELQAVSRPPVRAGLRG
jgi:acetyl esterase/lipase